MNSLYRLLEQQVISEGRKETVMAKYPDVDPEIIDIFVEGGGLDPDSKAIWKKKDNKYLEWMVSNFSKDAGYLSPNEIVDLVKNFYEKENILKPELIDSIINNPIYSEILIEYNMDLSALKRSPKDIRVYTLRGLEKFLAILNEIKTEGEKLKQTKSEGVLVAKGEYDGKNFKVVHPTTYAASCHYGKFSQWCTTTSNQTYYYDYMKQGNLYYFIQEEKPGVEPIEYHWADKTKTQPQGALPYKVALLIRDNGSTEWFSKSDVPYTDGWVGDSKLPWFTQDLADKIMNFNKNAIKLRSQKEIERIINARGFYKKDSIDTNLKSDLLNFLKNDIITNDQLIKIIKNDNYGVLINSTDVGKLVREKLGKENVLSLFLDLITTTSDLNELLTEVDTDKFLTTYIDKKMSEDDVRSVAQIILKRMGGSKKKASEIGSDVRLFIDKWTMTPEEFAAYQSQSDYFFIGIVSGDVKKVKSITQVDRFDGNTHDVIHIMMYEVKGMRPGSSLYAVKTEKNLLKDYMDDPNEIPQSIINTLFQKAKKIFGV